MVIDGRTLGRVLGSPGEEALAELASLCGGVVVCRASPAQKAAIVRMMARHKQQRLHVRPRLCKTEQGHWQRGGLHMLLAQKAAIVRMMARQKQQRLHVRPRLGRTEQGRAQSLCDIMARHKQQRLA